MSRVAWGRVPAWLWAVVVGVLAGLFSLFRLWLGNHDALTQVIWAEDGVFPLCVTKVGFWHCLTDPFAGYLLVLPRLIAGPVSMLPPQQWALATNLIAAALAGATAAAAWWVSRRFGLGWISAAVIATLPVIAPVTGFEAINAIGSSYMLLLYISALWLTLPRPGAVIGRIETVLVAVLLLLTALTIPLAGVLLAVLVVQLIRRSLAVKAGVVWGAVIVLGLVAQWITAHNAAKPRVVDISSEHLSSWAKSLPETILTFWPGMRLTEFSFFDVFPVQPFVWTGWLVAMGLVVTSVALLVRRGDRNAAVALLLLSGVGMGIVPVLIGGPNNRYFVVPVLLWGAALMVALDNRIRQARWWTVAVTAVVVLFIWWPGIPASWFRTSPAPPWQDEVARVEASCKADPGKDERIIFSPYWPPNWGDALSEPTHPNVPCLVVWSWPR